MNINFQNDLPYLEEVCINDIIKSNPTPFYLYSQTNIINTYKNLEKDLSSEIFYAIKANSNQAILRLMKNLGAGADVVSAGEMQRAITAGFNPLKIIFEGVGKSKEDIQYAINGDIRLINAESINEIKLIDQIANSLNKKINIGVRLNPDIDGNTLNKISTGKKTDKFGINIDLLEEIILLIKSLKNIELRGISCHVGSQLNNLKIFKKIFTTMKKTADTILLNEINLKHVDLGGGFAVNYEKDENDFNIKDLGRLVKLIFNDDRYKISFEPGRYIVAKSGFIISKILTTKQNGKINFIITDAGMHTFLRPSMYGAKHRIQALSDLDKENYNYTIAGPICESSDIISKEIILPKQKIGNYLSINDVGAYGAVMTSNYNSRGLPAEILVNKNQFAIIHEPANMTEIIKRDKIPNWF